MSFLSPTIPYSLHAKIMPKLITPIHTIRPYMYIHIHHTLNKVIQTKLTIINQKHEKNNLRAIFVPVSLKLRTLAQVKKVFRSS